MYLMTICNGQLCNQILYLVHVLATAIESRDKRVVDLFAKDVIGFTDLHPDAIPGCKVQVKSVRATKIHAFAELFVQRYSFATTGYALQNPRRIQRWVKSRLPKIVWSWCFRNPAAIAWHRAEICAFLKAKDRFCVRPQKIVDEARKDADKIVGVHIRRGDYKEFKGGSLWFSDAQYLDFMRQARTVLGGAVRFVIVSNEPVNISYFSQEGLDAVDASGLPQEDIVTLSLCDYIMGPSSTFSWWAAYYGDKPRADITAANYKIEKTSFRKVTD